MTPLKSFFSDYKAAGALHGLVNITCAVDDHVLATKSGDLVMFVSVRGIDPECLDPEQKDNIARRFEAGLRLFNERFRIYQYFVKEEHPGLASAHHPNPVVEEAIQNRVRHLHKSPEGGLYRTGTYLAVVYEGWHPAPSVRGRFLKRLSVLQRGLSLHQSEDDLGVLLDQARNLLRNRVSQWAVQCRDVVDIRVLNAAEGFGLLRRLLNYAPEKAEPARLKAPNFIDVQAVGSELECHRNYLRLDDHYIHVLTLKDPPSQTFAGMLNDLASLPSCFILASEWRREDPARIRGLIHSKRRHFHNAKTSLASYLPNANPSSQREALIDPSAVARVDDLGSCLEDIEIKGRAFGEWSLTLILYGKDLAALRTASAQAFKVFAAFDAQVVEERYNVLNAWLAALPGNAAFNLRRLWLTDANCADLSFVFGPTTGDPWNAHLGAEPLTLLETDTGVPYHLNLHCEDVAHSLILGATGSGKSFLLNFIVTHLQKYDPFTVIFDLGGSYRDLTDLLGGSYLSIRADERRFTINPFCLAPTPANVQFLLAFTRVLVESGGYRISAAEEQDLYHQIETLYQIAPQEHRLSTLARIVQRPLRAPFERWIQGGPYGEFFDHAEDTLTFSQLQTFDFEGLDSHKEVVQPLLFYILHRASAAMDQEPSRFKAFILDEAWRFFLHPVIKAYIVEALKTWRKKNAAMILATQSFDDLKVSDMLPVVMESCPTQIFLANPRMDKEAYRQAFHLNATETERIASLVPKRDMLIKQPGGSKVAALTVSPKEYWIYTSHPAERERKRKIFAEFGLHAGLDILTQEKNHA